MIQILCKLIHPMKVLEVGTSIGYSTVSMANIIIHIQMNRGIITLWKVIKQITPAILK